MRVQRHFAFEWDSAKAAANLRKHGVSFVTAARVLEDPDAHRFHIEELDAARNGEERWITTGSLPTSRMLILVIVWTMRGLITRIISARAATRQERHEYVETVFH